MCVPRNSKIRYKLCAVDNTGSQLKINDVNNIKECFFHRKKTFQLKQSSCIPIYMFKLVSSLIKGRCYKLNESRFYHAHFLFTNPFFAFFFTHFTLYPIFFGLQVIEYTS